MVSIVEYVAIFSFWRTRKIPWKKVFLLIFQAHSCKRCKHFKRVRNSGMPLSQQLPGRETFARYHDGRGEEKLVFQKLWRSKNQGKSLISIHYWKVGGKIGSLLHCYQWRNKSLWMLSIVLWCSIDEENFIFPLEKMYLSNKQNSLFPVILAKNVA